MTTPPAAARLSRSRRIWGRLALTGGGILSALVLLEMVLRFAGALLSPSLPKPSHAHLRILCLGESTTAPTPVLDYSWPKQLQTNLDAALGPGQASVINAGIPAINTNVILARLPGLLTLYHPQVVIAMMGVNDDAWYGITPKRSLLERTFFDLRVVKAVRYIYHGLPFAFSTVRESDPDLDTKWHAAQREASQLCQAGQFAQARLVLTPFLRSPKTFWRINNAAIAFISYDNPRAARQVELLASIAPPQVPKYWFHWLYLEHERQYRAAEIYTRGILLRSPHAVPAQQMLSETLWHEGKSHEGASKAVFFYATMWPPKLNNLLTRWIVYQFTGLRSLARNAIENLTAQFPYYAPIHGTAIMSDLKDEDITAAKRQMGVLTAWQPIDLEKLPSASSVTTRNYLRLWSMLKRPGIRLIVMQYPLRDPKQLKAIFGPRSGVPIISNRENFKEALKHLSYQNLFIDRFAGDFGHCTARGDALIAANVMAELRREGLLQSR